MAAPRRFPPPWSVEDPDPKLERQCFIVRDADGHALAYVYFEDAPGRHSAAHLLTRDEAGGSPPCGVRAVRAAALAAYRKPTGARELWSLSKATDRGGRWRAGSCKPRQEGSS
jgi:hypothetical protein